MGGSQSVPIGIILPPILAFPFEQQRESVLNFFYGVEDVVVETPKGIRRRIDEIRKSDSSEFIKFKDEAVRRAQDMQLLLVHGSMKWGTLGCIECIENQVLPRHKFIDNYTPRNPNVIMLLNDSTVYEAGNIFSNPREREEMIRNSIQQLKMDQIASIFGKDAEEVRRALERLLGMLMQNIEASTVAMGVGNTKYVEFIPAGLVAGLYYTTTNVVTASAIYIATSTDLVHAVTDANVRGAISEDLKASIAQTRATLDGWGDVLADRQRMGNHIASFDSTYHISLASQLKTNLMKDVVRNFWETFSESDPRVCTSEWNDFLGRGELDRKLEITKKAFEVRLENLTRYYNDFVNS